MVRWREDDRSRVNTVCAIHPLLLDPIYAKWKKDPPIFFLKKSTMTSFESEVFSSRWLPLRQFVALPHHSDQTYSTTDMLSANFQMILKSAAMDVEGMQQRLSTEPWGTPVLMVSENDVPPSSRNICLD